LKPDLVTEHGWKVSTQPGIDLYVAPQYFATKQVQHVLNQGIEVHDHFFYFILLRKSAHAADCFDGALVVVADIGKNGEQFVDGWRILSHKFFARSNIRQDGSQRLADFVRDDRGQFADRGEAGDMRQLAGSFFRLFPAGNISPHCLDGGDVSGAVELIHCCH
jgi:hypothetical protein